MSTRNKAILMVLLNTFSICWGMDTTTTNNAFLSSLPDESIGEIALALTSVCPTFSDAAYSINSFSLTSSRHHKIVNNPLITTQLIKRLRERSSFVPAGLLTLIRDQALRDSLETVASADGAGAGAAVTPTENLTEGTLNLYTGAALATRGTARWVAQQIGSDEVQQRSRCCLRYLLKANLDAPTKESRIAFGSLIATDMHIPINMSFMHGADRVTPFSCAVRSNMPQVGLAIFCRPEFLPDDNNATTMAALFRQSDLELTPAVQSRMLSFIRGQAAQTPRAREAVGAMLTQSQFIKTHRRELTDFRALPTTDSFIKFQIGEAFDREDGATPPY